ncbi:MAG: TRAM domain-containing protein [Candidatus Aenigmarchaeota archaeon]|nr:TRAM domain-containing protein [Candidatus Aenigmarchaeota archaeon]MCK4531312.1 TRAM domain-containing protein [Candidatus Aenigmarchaeota archaeon]
MAQIFGERSFRISRSHKKKDKYTKKKPPVKRGQILEIYIRDMSRKGDGVGKVEDFAVFVPGAEEGETVKVKITEVKKNCAVGKKVE